MIQFRSYKVYLSVWTNLEHLTDVEVWEWISNLIQHFTVYVITYPSWD